MKKAIAMILASTLALSGCAGTTKNEMNFTALGAGLGCLGGAALASLAGGDAKNGCIAGAVMGGLVGYKKGAEADLKLAEAAKKEIPALQIVTHDVKATDKATGKTETVKALKEMTIALPAGAMTVKDGREIVAKLDSKAHQLSQDSVVVIAGQKSDVKAAKKILAKHGEGRVKVTHKYGTAPSKMVITIRPNNTASNVTI